MIQLFCLLACQSMWERGLPQFLQIKIRMLQTVFPLKIHSNLQFQPSQQPSRTPISTPDQSILSPKNSARLNEDCPTVTPFERESSCPSGQAQVQEEEQQDWPEITAIVGRIRRLERELREERRTTADLRAQAAQTESRLAAAEQAQRQTASEAASVDEERVQLSERIEELEAALAEREGRLLERQQLIENIQFAQIKKNGESEERIRRLNQEGKELLEKVRKANSEAEKERRANQQLRESMAKQLESMQAHRDSHILDELHLLQSKVAASCSEREAALTAEVDQLTRTLYLQEQQLKRRDIELALADRKRQQALTEIADKKDQEIKLQKTLSKALNEKIGKLQEEVKTLKAQGSELHRNSRKALRTLNRSLVEEEISFELSPEKA